MNPHRTFRSKNLSGNVHRQSEAANPLVLSRLMANHVDITYEFSITMNVADNQINMDILGKMIIFWDPST